MTKFALIVLSALFLVGCDESPSKVEAPYKGNNDRLLGIPPGGVKVSSETYSTSTLEDVWTTYTLDGHRFLVHRSKSHASFYTYDTIEVR